MNADLLVRAELERVLAIPTLRQAPSLRRLLRYLVENTLEGHQDAIKESIIGIEVFQRGPDFDPRLDAIVRVQAANLRIKLVDHYDTDGRNHPLHIELPKGAYVPRISEHPQALPAPAVPARPRFARCGLRPRSRVNR